MSYALEAYTNAGSLPVSISGRITKLKVSHVLIQVHGVALIATELPKLILNMNISGENRNLVTSCDLLTLAKYADQNGGCTMVSTTDAYILLPIGSIDTNVNDVNYKIHSTADLGANAMTIDMVAYRLGDNIPILEYELRAMPTSSITFKRVMLAFDINTSYNDTQKTILTFAGNNSQMTVKHGHAFALNQAVSKVESANTFGLLYSDKDMNMGREITFLADATFNMLVVSYSQVN